MTCEPPGPACPYYNEGQTTIELYGIAWHHGRRYYTHMQGWYYIGGHRRFEREPLNGYSGGRSAGYQSDSPKEAPGARRYCGLGCHRAVHRPVRREAGKEGQA